MKFDVNEENGSLIFTLQEKKLDTSIAPMLKGEFLIICTSAVKQLILDLSKVTFCDSSGLSALLFAERQMRENGGKIKLVGLTEKVEALIKISKLDRVFPIYSSIDEALEDELEE